MHTNKKHIYKSSYICKMEACKPSRQEAKGGARRGEWNGFFPSLSRKQKNKQTQKPKLNRMLMINGMQRAVQANGMWEGAADSVNGLIRTSWLVANWRWRTGWHFAREGIRSTRLPLRSGSFSNNIYLISLLQPRGGLAARVAVVDCAKGPRWLMGRNSKDHLHHPYNSQTHNTKHKEH